MKKIILPTILLWNIFVANSAMALNESDLLGRWQCQSLMHASMPDKTGNFAEGWQKDSQGLSVTLDNAELRFTGNGAGNYQVASTSPNPFLYFSQDAVNSAYRVVGDQLVFTYYQDGTNFLWEIRQIADGQMRLVPLGNGYYPTVSCNRVGSGAATTSEPTTTTTATTAKQDVKKLGKVE